jgi:hypothetical protein
MQREEMELLADRIRRSLCRWRHRRESPRRAENVTNTTAHAEYGHQCPGRNFSCFP